ncbi:MAG: sugar porter family MFS transporter [Mangrovibacterium sp.]
MQKNKFNTGYLFTISMVSALGGLLFGYDWVVIGGAKPFYELYFGISNSPGMQGWAMSSALLGCLVGAVLSGVLSDKYGRKRLLIFAAFLFTLSAVGTGAVNNFTPFLVYRILGGIGIGLASNLSPMYIAEIAPAQMRGRYVSLNQLTIVLGILGAQLANWLIADTVPANFAPADILASWNGQMGWRYMFWAEVIPAGLFFLLMFFVPESPRWLASNSSESKVKGILSKIGGNEYADTEYANIKATIAADTSSMNLKELFQPKLRKILTIGIVLAVFQQWCGTNVIFNYAQEIFTAAGFGVSDILFNIVITGSVNVVFTFVALFTVDKLGRKPLLMIGAGGLTLIYILIGSAYFFQLSGWMLLVLVLLAIACYAMSLAPLVWVVISEIFPNRIRGAAMAVATFALWAACFLLTYTFPFLNNALGASGTFWLYGGICLAGFLFIYKNLPETKGKTLEEIEKEMVG